MQVQHEASLIESGSSKLSNHGNNSLDSYCLQPQSSNSLGPIEHLATSPSGSNVSLLACHMSQTNQILLFDTRTRKKRDKFPLKAYDKKYSRQSFQLSGMDFSPDGQRLAIGQTDCIIYIYRLTLQAAPSSSNTSSTATGNNSQLEDQSAVGLKPTITGKFAASSPITCMRWFELGIIFGSQDGRVRLILSFNKPPGQLPQAQVPQGDALGQISSNQPPVSQAPKVTTIFTSSTKGSMPISLTYRNSLLIVGQSDCSLSVLQLAAGGLTLTNATDTAGAQQASPLVGSDQSIQFPSDNLSGQVLSSSRRSSSITVQNLAVVNSTSFNHSCPPVHVAIIIQSNQTTTICCSGSDGRIAFYQLSMQQQQQSSQAKAVFTSNPLQAIDLNEDIMSMDYSSINEVLALATKNRLVFVKYDQESSSWRLQSSTIELRNVFTLATIRWLRDGGHLVAGCSSSSLELFKCVWSKQSINDKLDICHIARNRIRITDRERNLLATYKTQAEIKRVNLLDHGQSVLIQTANTLLLAKLCNQRLQSEIKWNQSNQEQKLTMKFLFDQTTSFVIIYDTPTNELSLLKLGNDFVSYSVKFPSDQKVKRDWLSVGQFPSGGGGAGQPLTPTSSSSPNRHKAISRNSSASTQRSTQHRHSSPMAGPSVGGTIATTDGQVQDEVTLSDQPAPPSITIGVATSRLLERFAYVTGGDKLNIIDLTDSNRVIFAERISQPIEYIKFSRTSRYLVFVCANRTLNLIQIRTIDQGEQEQEQVASDELSSRVLVDKSVLLERCESRSVHWLPESDSLVAQSGTLIHLWYDLDERERRNTLETYDSRAFNFLNKKPLIDLSLLDLHRHEANGGGSTEQQYRAGNTHQHYPVVARVADSRAESQLILSNGQVVPLSGVKTSFYAKLASGSLEAALELLDAQQRRDTFAKQSNASSRGFQAGTSLRPLYIKLGWLALESEDDKCELAWKIFNKLHYKKLANHLEQCLSSSEDARRELMLAKLRADWAKFELLANDQEEIVATYRRLNKWSLLIDYLTRGQQFRQRDLAQHDHLEWLIREGRHREAAQLKVRDSGDLVGALELLLRAQNLEAAAELVLKEQRLPLSDTTRAGTKQVGANSGLTPTERKLRDLVETELRDKLVDKGGTRECRQAAEISERVLGESGRALELYLASGEFEAALNSVSRQSDLKDRAKEIELQFANHLRDQFIRDPLKVSKKRAIQSIDHYLRAGLPLEALKMANLLRAPERGYGIIIEYKRELAELKVVASDDTNKDASLGEQLLDECRKLGWLFLSLASAQQMATEQDQDQNDGPCQRALKAFQMGEDYEQVAELLVQLGDFRRAFEVCLEQVNGNDRHRTEDQFIGLARVCGETSERSKQAEQLYVLMDKPELAIDMYEQLGEHDRMLELVEQYQPDQLEGRLLQLAKWLESCGRLEEAEKYLLRASQSEWTNVVRMYRLAERWPDAYRVARSNCISERDPLLVQLAYWWAKSIQVDHQEQEISKSSSSSAVSKSATNRARCLLLRKLNVLKQVVEFCCETKNFQFALELLDGADDGNDNNNDSGQPSESQRVKREVVLRYATFLEQQHKFEQAERLLVANNLIELAVRMYTDNDNYTAAIRLIENQLSAEGGGDRAEPAKGPAAPVDAKQRLVDLLNATLIECARRLVDGLTPANNRGSHLLSRAQPTPVGCASTATNSTSSPSDKLQMAQQMLLRAQRPELAIEMYQSLGMWREAILVAQRFAPRLLESVERALDEQVSDDIEPILRQTKSSQEAATDESGGQDQTSLEGDQVTGENERQQRSASSNIGQHTPVAAAVANQNELPEEAQIWRQFEVCVNQNDQRLARTHLDKYLALLIEKSTAGEFIASSRSRLRPIERFLLEMRQQRSPLVSSILSEAEISRKLLALADEVAGSEFGWSGCVERSGHDVRTSWLSLRNILACYAKLATGSPIPVDEPAIERRVLVAHFVTMHCSLLECLRSSLDSKLASGSQQQQRQQSFSSLMTIKQVVTQVARASRSDKRVSNAVDLLGKLSFSLLRYTDLLEPTQVLWVAGLWQLAQNKARVARLIWATLVELSDQNRVQTREGSLRTASASGLREMQRLASELISSKLGSFVDLPELVLLDTTKSTSTAMTQRVISSLPAQRLNQVRQWLLETLIEGGGAGGGNDHQSGLPPRGWASLRPGASTTVLLRACRVCGLPVKCLESDARGQTRAGVSNGTQPLGQTTATTNAVRREELFKLISLCEIESDKLMAAAASAASGRDLAGDDGGGPTANMEELDRLIGEIDARRRGAGSGFGGGQRQPRQRQLTARDHLNEIVEFILDS